MATKEVIEIEAKTGKAQGEIESLRKEIEKLSKSQGESNNIQKENSKSIGKLASSMSTLVKGAGIGIAIKLFESFTEVLGKNQRVADFFSTALEAVSIVFNDLVEFVLNNTGAVIDSFKSLFENPVESIKSLGEAIKDNIIERFNSLLDTLGFVGDAISKFITGDFEGAKEAALNAGKELVDVYTGVNNSVDKLSKVVNEGAEALGNYGREVFKTAQENVKLQKTAERATALNQGLIEQYDRQAEKLRQVRDEERNTLEDRIKANNELKDVLDAQEKAMLANANAILASAQAQFNKNQNQENEIALIEAQNEVLAVQAQIEGFRSEQKTNDLALSRELAQVDRDRAQQAIDSYEVEQRAAIESQNSEELRIEKTIELENELYQKRVDLINARLELEKEGSVTYEEILNDRAAIEAEYNAQRIANEKASNDFAINLKKKEEEAKLNITGQALGAAAALAEEGSNISKGLAVAQVLLDTYKGIQAAFASNAANVGATALTGGAWPYIQAASAAAFGAANVSSILSVDPLRGGSSVSSPSGRSPSLPSGAAVAANTSGPQFNTVSALQQNRLLGDISNAVGQPARAYVVSSDISTAQELERRRVKNASF